MRRTLRLGPLLRGGECAGAARLDPKCSIPWNHTSVAWRLRAIGSVSDTMEPRRLAGPPEVPEAEFEHWAKAWTYRRVLAKGK